MMLTVSAAPSIPFTHGEPETPAKYRTPASSVPYSMTPLSLIETPSKPFEDLVSSDLVENFAAEEESTNSYTENDAAEKERSSIMKRDQGYVTEDQRAKGLVTFEEAFLLNKSDKVGNEVENAQLKKPQPSSAISGQRSEFSKIAKEKMKKIAGKFKMITMLICATWARRIFLRTITS